MDPHATDGIRVIGWIGQLVVLPYSLTFVHSVFRARAPRYSIVSIELSWQGRICVIK
jgi:hypothetical protein